MHRLVLLLACLLAVDCTLVGVNPVTTGRRVFHQRNLNRASSFGAKTLHSGVKAPVKQPLPHAAKAPVVQAPVQAPVKAPLVQAPLPAPVKAPVVQAPVQAPVKAPLVQAPVQAPVKAPLVQAPLPAPVKAPVVQAPLPTPVKAPEVQQVQPVEEPVQQFAQEPVQAPVQVVNEPEPVEQFQAPVEQAPVEQAPVEQAPVEQAPVVQEQFPVEPQVVEQFVHSASGAFSCHGRQFGYYADVQQGCKVYHVCNPLNAVPNVSDGHYTFTCPETTRFDQRYHTCTPESVALECSQSESLYPQTELRFANVN